MSLATLPSVTTVPSTYNFPETVPSVFPCLLPSTTRVTVCHLPAVYAPDAVVSM